MAGVEYGGVFPALPYETAAKAAATARDYDAKVTKPCNIVGISVYDSGEQLNGDLLLVSMLDENATTIFNFPTGAAGGDTVYSWNGSIPAEKNYVVRVNIIGPTATSPIIRVMWRPRGQA